ncbi:MAG TPA: type II toxin-antitoxin system HicA family toxin [Thermoanaerobaculia bacterium]|nr:type II toxin-antitoxin system HicA family toxin [Thermoanaerobaculia bacterium]
MPGKLRALGGAEVVRALGRFGFHQVKQSGSHVKLRRTGPGGESQTLHIPLHRVEAVLQVDEPHLTSKP